MTKEEIDILWNKALRESVEDGRPYLEHEKAQAVLLGASST